MTLARSDMILIRRAHYGLRVRCTQGLAWVAVRGDETDHVLAAGEELVFPPIGRIIVNSLAEGTSVELASPSGGKVRSRRIATAAATRPPDRKLDLGLWSGLNGWARVVGERL